jgi:uncharacterized membrane protein
MDRHYPSKWYGYWRVFLCLSFFSFLFVNYKGRHTFLLDGKISKLVFGSVIFLNVFLHYYASFVGDFQPQGRYLFPALILFMTYPLALLSEGNFKKSRNYIFVFLGIFMFFAAVRGIPVASENPRNLGYNPVAKEPIHK